MEAADRRVTYTELQQWPNDGRQRELHDGEVVVVPAPFPRHQRVASNIEAVLREYAEATGGLMLHAPLDIVFSEHHVLQPDVVYFRAERRRLVRDWEATRAAPDLAVEVLSQSTEARDRTRKMDILAQFGVQEVWIVDPARNTAEVFVLRGGAYDLVVRADTPQPIESPTLGGLSFDTSRVFAG